MTDKRPPLVTIITPTTGKTSLLNLIESISRQKVPVNHLILWDDKRGETVVLPETINDTDYLDAYGYLINNIVIKGEMVQGDALGSSLRAIGLMAANTPYVTFADDDIMWEENHLETMLMSIKDKNWAFCKRKIWTKLPNGQYEFLGIDEFESVGEAAKTPYKMVDNNCMMFSRRLGSSAAVLYRETMAYNDDRLMYDFLKTYGGEPGLTNNATVNQICPERLVNFFKQHCTL